ncbi:MAG: hypothetical protein KY446_06090 [Proteobacteria bacterium]|nr:hypothetical protein [Pseudomonadota bacterium]MBW3617312.1 hypothetical protein [Pseudomonadota bacterium]
MERSDIHDLIAEAAAGACAALAVALVLQKSPAVKEIASRVPRLGWKPNDQEDPPILARLAAGALSTLIFRSVFSLTRTAARQVL